MDLGGWASGAFHLLVFVFAHFYISWGKSYARKSENSLWGLVLSYHVGPGG